jgi:hypothetical protein
MIIKYYKARKKVIIAAASAAELATIAARDEIMKQAGYFSGNATLAVVEKGSSLLSDGAKVVGSSHNGIHFGKTAFKGLEDAARGDRFCTGLCVAACACDAVGVCYTLIPLLPGKVVVYAGTKCISLGCVAFRDSCNAAGVKIPGC